MAATGGDAKQGGVIGSSGKEICRAFRNTGKCRFDKECKFEHSTGDKITPPPRDFTPKGDCHNWTKEQKCRFGDRCRFLHGSDDKRTTYRPERKHVEESTTGERQICRNYQSRGRCRFGDRCRHLHVAGDKKTESKGSKSSEEKKGRAQGDGDAPRRRRRPRGPRRDGAGAGAGGAAPKKESKVLREEDKFDADGVELCRNFRNTGRCRFGDSCTYSHVPGAPIGHPMNRPIKGDCRTFKETGNCTFGAECRFKHGDQDTRTEVPRRRTRPAAASS